MLVPHKFLEPHKNKTNHLPKFCGLLRRSEGHQGSRDSQPDADYPWSDPSWRMTQLHPHHSQSYTRWGGGTQVHMRWGTQAVPLSKAWHGSATYSSTLSAFPQLFDLPITLAGAEICWTTGSGGFFITLCTLF